MAKKYKIIIPKAGASNELGTEAKLYMKDEVVETKEDWQQNLMDTFVTNGWAMETKEEVTSDVEEAEPVRARNEKGQLVGDDPSTPDVNEAWEGGVAPKKTTKKKATTKKTTKKKS
jgi:hypothetical protein